MAAGTALISLLCFLTQRPSSGPDASLPGEAGRAGKWGRALEGTLAVLLERARSQLLCSHPWRGEGVGGRNLPGGGSGAHWPGLQQRLCPGRPGPSILYSPGCEPELSNDPFLSLSLDKRLEPTLPGQPPLNRQQTAPGCQRPSISRFAFEPSAVHEKMTAREDSPKVLRVPEVRGDPCLLWRRGVCSVRARGNWPGCPGTDGHPCVRDRGPGVEAGTGSPTRA